MGNAKRKDRYKFTKYITFVLLFLFLYSFNLNAQKPKKDYSSILLIPLRPGMFESDVMEVQETGFFYKFERFRSNNNSLIRWSLDKTLFDNLLVYFDIKRLLYYDTKITRQDLDYVYRATNYYTYYQRIKGYYCNFPHFTVFQVVGSSKKRWGVNCLSGYDYKPFQKNPKLLYTEVVIRDSNLIPYLNKRYKCDYVLFVNHIELKTRFKVCMDLMKNIHQKDIILHFTLYDKEAEKTIGGLVGITYAPSENNLIEIVKDNFGILAGLVAEVISSELKEPLRVELDY